jgi:ethanolamine utilization protein EutN
VFVGRVVGATVSTIKDQRLVGWKLLVVQPLELLVSKDELAAESRVVLVDKENPVVAIDSVGAGAGELVLVSTGSSARASLPSRSPVDASIVGIVDTIDVPGTIGVSRVSSEQSDGTRSDSQ